MELEALSPITCDGDFLSRWQDVCKCRNYNDYIEEWLTCLSAQRSFPVQSTEIPYNCIDSCTVEIIFSVCKAMEQPADSRYLTVELLDRFIPRYYEQLRKAIELKNTLDWKSAITYVRRQFLLRIISCVQLSSKYSSHSSIVSLQKAHSYLISVGETYSKPSILKSERRVFKCLDFQVNIPTLLTYVDGLLHLTRTLTKTNLYEACIGITDIVYLKRNEIFRKLHDSFDKNRKISSKDKSSILAIKCNGLFCAAAIILTAVRLCCNTNNYMELPMSKALSDLTKYPLMDINLLSILISEIIGQN